MKKEDLLVTRLRNYGKSDQVPCHMPGHKRNQESWLTFDFPNPFSIDITEIDGFDNLHHPEGVNYSYIIEPAVAMSGCYKSRDRLKSREGIIRDIRENDRGFYIIWNLF